MGRPHVSPPLTHQEALARILHACNLGPEFADRVAPILYALAPDRMNLNVAAARFGVSSSTLNTLHKKGRLAACNIGQGTTKYLMFSSADLHNHFATSYATPALSRCPTRER
jgi:hypothetical protein